MPDSLTAGQVLCADDDVALRICTDGDILMMYQLAAAAPKSWLRMCTEGLPDPHRFASTVWEGVLFQAIIEVEGLAVGVAAVTRPKFLHGTAWVEIIGRNVYRPLDREFDRAGRLLVEHAFRRWRFRKLYSQHGSYESPPFAPCESFDVVEEARLPDALYHDGLTWDLVVSGIWSKSARTDDPPSRGST